MKREIKPITTLGELMIRTLKTGKNIHLTRKEAEPIYGHFHATWPQINAPRKKIVSRDYLDQAIKLKQNQSLQQTLFHKTLSLYNVFTIYRYHHINELISLALQQD